MACDCSRSRVAASGSASASAGIGRCLARSASHWAHVESMPVAEVMPPTGNQPVRAARKTSASDPINGGTDSATTENTRTTARPRPRDWLPE